MLARTLFFIVSLSLLVPLSSNAKTWSNSYISFDLPERWDCHLEGTEWICNSLIKENSQEAIIILTAKEVGPADSLQEYERHLKTPRTVPDQSGKPTRSQVKHVKRTKINNHEWVDGMHLGSEIPSYYTRYLATVKDRLALLVTFSAHQKHFTKYSTDFFRAISSLRVTGSNQLFNPSQAQAVPGSNETLGQNQQPALNLNDIEDYPSEPKQNNSGKIIALLVLIAAIAGFVIMKRKSKK